MSEYAVIMQNDVPMKVVMYDPDVTSDEELHAYCKQYKKERLAGYADNGHNINSITIYIWYRVCPIHFLGGTTKGKNDG